MTGEFALAAACCRWPPSPARGALVRSAAVAIDWPLFAAVARRHRIEGLVWAALRDAGVDPPEPEAARLREEAGQIARENLLIAAESRRLAQGFGAAGVPLLFVKGLTLGMLAYDSVALKKGWDIDLLVAPDRTGEAARLLEELGYEAILPQGASSDQLRIWHVHWKESVWRNAGRGHVVELHTSLVNSPYLLPDVGMDSARVMVKVARGVDLPTLPRDELFAYLCVHGASSGWFRLKWLADLAALAGCDAAETERLYRRSQQLGAGRAAAQALLLASELLGTPLPEGLGRELRASGTNRRLAEAAKRLMDGGMPATDLHERRFGTWAIHWSQFLLLPGLPYKWRELKRQLADPEHRMRYDLPKPLRFLYPIMRIAGLAAPAKRGRG